MEHPFESALRCGYYFTVKLIVIYPLHNLGEKDKEQRGSIDTAIVGGMRNLFRPRCFTLAYLMDNFSGLFITPAIDLGTLMLRQITESMDCKLRIDHQGL